MTIHYNKYSERDKRRALRRSPTEAEQILWEFLRKKQISGYRFRRQYGVDAYVIDFYCPEIKLAIELDGEVHFTESAIEYDRHRQEYLETFGITFLRFTNKDVFNQIEKV